MRDRPSCCDANLPQRARFRTPIKLVVTYASDDKDQKEETPPSLSSVEFLKRYREQVSTFLCNAYVTKHDVHYSQSGAVSSSLGADVFSLVYLQLSILHDYLLTSGMLFTASGDSLLIKGVDFIVLSLWYKQLHFRNRFYSDLESCYIAANDFYRMMENTDLVCEKLENDYPHLALKNSRSKKWGSGVSLPLKEAEELASLYGTSAVHAAYCTHFFIYESIRESSIEERFFGYDWEDLFRGNEVARSLTYLLDEYLADTESLLMNALLFKKAIEAVIRATIIFYLRCLVRKAQSVRRKQNLNKEVIDGHLPFMSPKRALLRMKGDIHELRTFFEKLIPKYPSLCHVLEEECHILVAIIEYLDIAAGLSDSQFLYQLIVVIHKETGGNVDVSKQFLGDLWALFAPPNRSNAGFECAEAMEEELRLISHYVVDKSNNVYVRKDNRFEDVPGLSLKEMLHAFYQAKRKTGLRIICATETWETLCQCNGKGAMAHLSSSL